MSGPAQPIRGTPIPREQLLACLHPGELARTLFAFLGETLRTARLVLIEASPERGRGPRVHAPPSVAGELDADAARQIFGEAERRGGDRGEWTLLPPEGGELEPPLYPGSTHRLQAAFWAEDQLQGVVAAEWSEGKPGADALQRVQEGCADLGLALRNVRLTSRFARRSRDLGMIHHLARSVSGLPARQAVTRTVAILQNEFRYHYVCVMLGDYERRELELLAHASDCEVPVEPGARLPFTEGLMGKAFRLGQTVHVRDTAADPIYVDAIPQVRSEICVPVLVGEYALGLLDAQHHQVAAFCEADVVALECVSHLLVPHLAQLSPGLVLPGPGRSGRR